MTARDLPHQARQLKDWVVNQALPEWAARGQLSDNSWVEHLHLDGSPDMSAERRWRVLARQAYVYAEVTRLGWFDGADIAQRTFKQMRDIGFVGRVTMDDVVTERRRDFYDHAFFLLASASLYRLTQEQTYLDSAEFILDTLDADFEHPAGGWVETPRGKLPRRQNPHMHLFEASLYLYGHTQNARHLHYAERVFELFKAHFFDANHAVIREFFDNDWTPVEGALGETAEPGHAMEWVWLLSQFEAASGQDTAHYRRALYTNALRGGNVFLNDEEDVRGTLRRATKRLWVQTEVIKAHLAQAANGVDGARERAAETMAALQGTYLNPDGTWNDQLSEDGTMIATTIPVSTMYHIVCMITESCRVAGVDYAAS